MHPLPTGFIILIFTSSLKNVRPYQQFKVLLTVLSVWLFVLYQKTKVLYHCLSKSAMYKQKNFQIQITLLEGPWPIKWKHQWIIFTLHNHLCKPSINKHKKDSSKSLYGGTLCTTSKSHLRLRSWTMIEQVKEYQKTQSFPLNSNWKIGGI